MISSVAVHQLSLCLGVEARGTHRTVGQLVKPASNANF